MRILILTFGTRGDVQPYVALAHGRDRRRARGRRLHRGRLPALGRRRRRAVPPHEQRHVGPHPGRDADDERRRRQLPPDPPDDGGHARLPARPVAGRPNLRTDLLVYHPKSLGGLHIAERLRHPGVAVSLPLPFFTPTRAFPIPFIGHWPLGGTANRLSYQFNRFTALAYGGMINTFRRHTLGLGAAEPVERLPDLARRPPGPRSSTASAPPSSPSRPTTRRMPTSPATGSCPTRRPGSRRRSCSPSWPPASHRSTSASAAWASARTPTARGDTILEAVRRVGARAVRRHRLGRHRPHRRPPTMCSSSATSRTTGCCPAPPPSSITAAPAPPPPVSAPAAPP